MGLRKKYIYLLAQPHNRHACCSNLVVTDVLDGRVQLQQHMPTGQEPSLKKKQGYCNRSREAVTETNAWFQTCVLVLCNII